MLIAAAALFVTACDSKDDNPSSDDEKKKDETPVAAVMEHTITVTDMMFSTFDFTIDYYDTDGTIKSEAMTGKEWTKTVLAPLPSTLGGCLRGTLKEGVDISSEEKITAECHYLYACYAVNKDGEFVGAYDSKTLSKDLDVKRSKLTDWLDLINQRGRGFVSIRFDFDGNGKFSQVTWGAK